MARVPTVSDIPQFYAKERVLVRQTNGWLHENVRRRLVMTHIQPSHRAWSPDLHLCRLLLHPYAYAMMFIYILAPEQSDQQLLVTSGQNTLTIFNTISLTPETLTLDITTGSVSKLVYSATDDFFYYSTLAPATIRKMKRDGSQSKLILSTEGSYTYT